jgi:bile acid-coenzyme A ligase
VLHDRFDAETVLDSLERYGVSWCFFVPTMLHRLLRVPGVEDVDFARLEVLWHAAAACPRWLKRRWIDLLGPERVLEAFGGTESVGLTVIDGVEWSRREGSVGRAVASLLRVRNENGSLCAPAEVGEIFMRPTEPIFGGPPADVPFEYVGGSPVRRDVEGFYSLGDLGFLDENGFLFPVERRADLVITGGENVYPAEVEGVLLEHPLVQDVAVIGLPDEDLGRRVHAVVAVASPGSRGDHLETLLRDFALERLSRSKVPRSFEIVESLPRDGAGKLRRSALVAERTHDVLARRD